MTPSADAGLPSLFAAYARAFDAFDAPGVAAFYHLPCLMVRAGTASLFDTHDALLKNMEDLFALHRQHNYGRAAFAAPHITDLGERLAIVTVSWTIHTQTGTVLWQFATTYNLLQTPDGWKILVATTHAA